MKTLIIGQAPGPNTDPLQPLPPLPRTCAGGRLADLAGLTPEEYLKAFDRANLLQFFPGRTKRDDSWKTRDARIAAGAMKPLLRGRRVILLGQKVADAFGYPARHLDWHSWFEDSFWGFEVAAIPHTSGRSHWYRKPENLEASQLFWTRLLKTTRGPDLGLYLEQLECMPSPLRKAWLEGEGN